MALWIVAIAGPIVAAVLAWWAFLRFVTVRLPARLAEGDGSDRFRDWLSDSSDWILFGRDMDGHYLLVAGSLRAQRIRKRWLAPEERQGVDRAPPS
ncbi:MAG: hypothetical protein ACJ8ER_02145 [Allosphingosinicella sp.]